jgi:cytochrome bd-type quinol oxidase subunit 2
MGHRLSFNLKNILFFSILVTKLTNSTIMKKAICLLVMISTISSGFCQLKTKEYYLKKSKRQKTTGWILLGVGTVAVIAGATAEKSKPSDGSFSNLGIGLGGLLVGVIGISALIGSETSKSKAAAMAIGTQTITAPGAGFNVRMQPAVGLKVGL